MGKQFIPEDLKSHFKNRRAPINTNLDRGKQFNHEPGTAGNLDIEIARGKNASPGEVILHPSSLGLSSEN